MAVYWTFPGRAIKENRDKFVVCTKFGMKYSDGKFCGLDSSPENVRGACEGCLKRLGIDYIDLFYQHRVDPATPIEDTVRELKVRVFVLICRLLLEIDMRCCSVVYCIPGPPVWTDRMGYLWTSLSCDGGLQHSKMELNVMDHYCLAGKQLVCM